MKKEHVIERQGKKFVLYEGLLDEAHQKGLKRIETQLIQIPGGDNGNVAIVRAEVETENGIFTGIGDATPGNVNRMIAAHLIRMAETRAKARALRDAVNIGMTSVEEIGDDLDAESGGSNGNGTVPTGDPNRPASLEEVKAAKETDALVKAALDAATATSDTAELQSQLKPFVEWLNRRNHCNSKATVIELRARSGVTGGPNDWTAEDLRRLIGAAVTEKANYLKQDAGKDLVF